MPACCCWDGAEKVWTPYAVAERASPRQCVWQEQQTGAWAVNVARCTARARLAPSTVHARTWARQVQAPQVGAEVLGFSAPLALIPRQELTQLAIIVPLLMSFASNLLAIGAQSQSQSHNKPNGSTAGLRCVTMPCHKQWGTAWPVKACPKASGAGGMQFHYTTVNLGQGTCGLSWSGGRRMR